MKVLITGSREFTDAALLVRVLDDLLARYGALILVHGACPTGADAIADRWGRRAQATDRNVLIDRFPANWGTYGRAAGMRRNAEMVSAGADLCLAFFEPGATNRGTAHCAKLAQRAGIPVDRYGRESDTAASVRS